MPWTKLIGILLVALALRLALDPDYPIPRGRLAGMQPQHGRQEGVTTRVRGDGDQREQGALGEKGASDSRPASRAGSRQILPEALAPRAPVRRSELTFRWQWAGAPADWRVVVFADSFERIVEFRVGSSSSHTPDAESLATLPPRMSGFWLVEATLEGRKVSSVPMPLDLLD